MKRDQSTYILGGLIFVAVIVVAFFVGMRVGQRQQMTVGANPYRPMMRVVWGNPSTGRRMMYSMRGGMQGGLMGQVQSVNGNQLTIKSSNGVIQTFTMDPNATVTKVSKDNTSIISQGDNVILSGTTTNGTYTVTNIRINPSPTTTPAPTTTASAQ